MHYYGTRLTENISRRDPEGYLLCLNVPVARTGIQEYLPEELGISFSKENTMGMNASGMNAKGLKGATAKPPGSSQKVPFFSEQNSFVRSAKGLKGAIAKPPGLTIEVLRPEEEVFSPETIASFEGMPVTNNHPPDGVDIDNIRFVQMGHAHNVRRGTGAEADLLLADLIITDPHLIDQILSGKREISCGYTYELCEENGQYIQRRIRGNHIAVVDAGRAGPRVSIKDHKMERRKTSMNKPLANLLARIARDGDPATVAEFIEEMIAENTQTATPSQPEATEAPAPEPAPETTVTLEVPEQRQITVDEDQLSGILERLDKLIALLTPPEPAADNDPAEEIAEVVEEVLESAEGAETLDETGPAEPSGTLEEEKDPDETPDPLATKDTLRAVLRAVRPALAGMTPAQRRRVCGDIAANLGKPRRAGDARVYAGLAAAKGASRDLSSLGQRIMASRNPCYKP